MSAHKSRFFQHAGSSVVRVSHPAYMRDYEEDPTVTEVQVVPSDAIVIPRDELPKVSRGERMLRLNGTTPVPYTTADQHRSDARTHLALAEYLREHPPVDEAQVAAVRDALLSADSDDVNYIEGDDAWKLARRMVERGVRVEKS